jgi:hypothetical protein
MCISGTDALSFGKCLGEAKASLPRAKMLSLMVLEGGF